MDHNAILKAYPTVVTIDDSGIILDANNNSVTVEQSKIDAARAELNVEIAATQYQEDRRRAYPDLESQLDYIYHNGIDKWKTDIVDPVKTKYPKPS